MPIRELVDIFMEECRFQGENRYSSGFEPVFSPLPLQLPEISDRIVRIYTGSELISSMYYIFSKQAEIQKMDSKLLAVPSEISGDRSVHIFGLF